MKKHNLYALLILIVVVMIVIISGRSFVAMQKLAPIYPGEGIQEIKMLSDYFPGLKNTPGDTEVYYLKGEKPGASVLVLGGTHPNEPAGYMSAIVMIENLKIETGSMFIIPRANRSAFTHNDPQEGHPQQFTLKTAGGGERWFRYGSRATNPIHQWPDPDVYIHQSGQKLSGNETRNLNRNYPGLPNATLTEKIAYGITQLIQKEKIDISLDLHEASPEYPVVNAIVAHQRSRELAAIAMMELQLNNLQFILEESPINFHGLSHREWGDSTDTMALLMETANPIQGRLRGKTSAELILSGLDPCYIKASKLGRLYVDYDETGIPLAERVGRNLAAFDVITNSYNMLYPKKALEIDGLPGYQEVVDKGIGALLKEPK